MRANGAPGPAALTRGGRDDLAVGPTRRGYATGRGRPARGGGGTRPLVLVEEHDLAGRVEGAVRFA